MQIFFQESCRSQRRFTAVLQHLRLFRLTLRNRYAALVQQISTLIAAP
jgi:hypothetical protein